MIKPTTLSRWNIAQNSEREFWSRKFSKKSIMNLEKKYSQRAKFITKELSKFKKLNKNIKVLQIGCAALDMIYYISFGKKYAIDPLADFYGEFFKIDYKNIHFKKGIVEKLPYENSFFDIIILANVLDHVQNPEKALSEIKRVLKDEGLFYLEVDVSNKAYIFLANIWRFLNSLFGKIFNKPHPYIFSLDNIANLVKGKFILKKKYPYPNRYKKPLFSFLDKIGFSSNNYYRAIYSKTKEKKQ